MTAEGSVDPRHLRDVLGCYPTGVCVVTSSDTAGGRHGLVVGSFTSISLEPPLIGFFPDKRSSSWPSIADTGRFCVNVLGCEQADLCGRFAAKSGDKFLGLEHGRSPGGLPLLDGALAWIDCVIERIAEIGDHWLVVGAVAALGKVDDGSPLLFFRGGYHTLQGFNPARGA